MEGAHVQEIPGKSETTGDPDGKHWKAIRHSVQVQCTSPVRCEVGVDVWNAQPGPNSPVS